MTLLLTQGNALKIPLADESVHCVVTSPPYWGLRDYGIGDQLGLEPTPEQYVANMVAVFREVRRVLRSDGQLWLNLGDSYAATSKGENRTPEELAAKSGLRRDGRPEDARIRQVKNSKTSIASQRAKIDLSNSTLKPKDLCGIPWRVAFALQADGWWLRDAIPWVKAWMKTDNVPMWDMPVDNILDGSAMPGSQQDRPTTSYEMIFLLAKSKKYYFDPDAIKAESGAMFRNVWRMNPQSYSGAHFATFTPQLPKYAIQFGTSERGVCPECGAPWERVTEVTSRVIAGGTPKASEKDIELFLKTHGTTHHSREGLTQSTKTTLGWRPTCECSFEVPHLLAENYRKPFEPIPATVFDPFAGSGTTLQVARALGRNGVGLDLSLEYLHLARERLMLDALDAWTEGVAREHGENGSHKNKNIPGQKVNTMHAKRNEKGVASLPMFEGLRAAPGGE